MAFNPLEYPASLEDARRLTDIDSWHRHVPFAFALVQMLKPKVFVELGTHKGDSYCAFCQAVDALGLDTSCYAVDTWQGDPHAGQYDESVFEELKAYHDQHYGRFSTLLRMTFDQALGYFSDGSIDLLHIDGLHTYEAASHDLEAWVPKMSRVGVVLLHDTNVREGDFGVWRLWDDLKGRYPSFELKHGYGLGVISVGDQFPESLAPLFDCKDDWVAISKYFSRLGDRIALTRRLEALQAERGRLELERQEDVARIEHLQREVAQLQHRAADLERELAAITSGAAWRILQMLGRIRSALLVPKHGRNRTLGLLTGIFGALRRNGRLELLYRILEYRRLRRSGLFDPDYYLEENPDVASAGADPLLHYILYGCREGRNPNCLFHTSYYLRQNPDLVRTGTNPLIHYVDHGWKVGLNPSPWFDTRFYLESNPDVANAGINPLLHFLRHGKSEGRPYVRDEQVIPLQRERHGNSDGDHGKYKEAYASMVAAAAAKGDGQYVPLAETDLSSGQAPVKLIAFYLPQFHPIPENDAWWGKGFTEWANVSKAAPQFAGHYQPRLPGELGFYDLRVPEVQRRQVQLARKYGIYGFCFHYYWFNGRRLLWRPIEQFISDPEIDFPFCLCWANENWTRRWDGLDDEVLIAQIHSQESDQAFIRDIEPILRHKNYIRVNGSPLLIIYQAQKMVEPAATVRAWKQHCREVGIGGLYVVAALTFGLIDPREVGFDAAVEFPPHCAQLAPITHTVTLLNPAYQGRIYRYWDLIRWFAESPDKSTWKLFKTVCPSWDNEARRPGRGVTYAFSSPEAYKDWLSQSCRYALEDPDPEKRLVFINAWNEWGEGAHLEPDRKYGYAYLQATADALRSLSKAQGPGIGDGSSSVLPVTAVRRGVAGVEVPSPTRQEATTSPGRWKILFVTHDTHVGGAQSSLLEVISWFKNHTCIDPRILCLDGGDWVHRFEGLGDVMVLSKAKEAGLSGDDLVRELRVFCGGRPALIYGNTVASGRAYQLLRRLGAPIITHVHELQMSIERYAADWIWDILSCSSHFIACSKPVQQNLVERYGIDPSKITLVYESIRRHEGLRPFTNSEKRQRRSKLGLWQDGFVVFGCGVGMPFRKGADLFIEVARAMVRRGLGGFHLYWIGDFGEHERDDRLGLWQDHLAALRRDRLEGYVTFLGFKEDPEEYLLAGDAFLLPSREDPFPLVALEAAECGLPIVCFAGAGGMPEFVEEDAGFVVPYGDTAAMAEKVVALMEDGDLRHRLGMTARDKLLGGHTPHRTVPAILSACRSVAGRAPAVSVIVPNYNHARYLQARLDSIFNQTFRDFEVILLDDASTDNSVGILERYAHFSDVRLVRNQTNSGSPFKQWLKGLDIARADIIWIAESDDVCEPNFLEMLLPAFRNPRTKLAYTDSYVIDDKGEITGEYLGTGYLTSLSEMKWRRSYEVDATQEINDGLGIKNTILNISAVLFRRFPIDPALRQTLEGMRIAGDWYFIVHAIYDGNVHYLAQKLNYHRRHCQSVIARVISEKWLSDFFAEVYTVHRHVLATFELEPRFSESMEKYLRTQWRDFCPDRPFEDLNACYPVDRVLSQLRQGCQSVRQDLA